MDFRRLRYFVAVAEERHFRRAADRLNMSQPPLSQQIRSLESELKVPLFIRSKRSVALTEAGEVLLRRARALIASAEAAAIEARQVGRGELGALVVSFMSSAMLGRLSQILRSFRHSNPGVHIQLKQLCPQDQITAVATGQIDVGFVAFAPPRRRWAMDGIEISAEAIWEEELVAAVSVEHRLAHYQEVPLRTLAQEPFITLPTAPATGYFDQLVQICRRAGFEPRIQQEVEQLPAALTLIAAGYGIALMPVCVCEGWQHLVVFPRIREAPRIGVMMIRRLDNRSPALAAFRESVDRAAPCPFFAAPRMQKAGSERAHNTRAGMRLRRTAK